MFLSIALSKVVPYFIFLFDDSQVTQSVNSAADRALWERVYATLAVADREGENSFLTLLIYLHLILIIPSASIILHTILRSIRPASSQTIYHDPTLARMQPLSPSETTEVLELLTPDMQDLVIEANIKNNNAGPIATAWEAALLKAIHLPPIDSGDTLLLEKKLENGVENSDRKQSPERPSSARLRAKNFWEKEVVEEVTVPDANATAAAAADTVSELPLEEQR